MSSPFQLSQGGVHCPCISHVARCLALLYQLHPAVLFLLSQTPPQSVPCCSQLFSCLPNFSSISSTLALLSAALLILSVQLLISCCIWLISSSLPLNHSFVLFSSMPHTSSTTLYLLSSPSWLYSSSHPFWCVYPV